MACEQTYCVPISRKERLERAGYNPIHLFGDVYLVRNRSIKARRFSMYVICVLREDQ